MRHCKTRTHSSGILYNLKLLRLCRLLNKRRVEKQETSVSRGVHFYGSWKVFGSVGYFGQDGGGTKEENNKILK